MFKPRYLISDLILKHVGWIEGAKEVIDYAVMVPAWEAKFKDEAAVRTVHFGTKIEGNELNYSQARRVMAGQEVLGRERDIQEVINYKNVLEYIDRLAERYGVTGVGGGVGVYTQAWLKKIHELTSERILEPGQCGVYRTTRVVVKNSRSGEVSFRPPLPLEVPVQLEEFFFWINSDLGRGVHPVLRAGITHYELVRIHPFVDGNGRVARAFATLVMLREGYDVKRFFSLEEHFDQYAEEYYTALQQVSLSQGDLTGWLEYFTQVVALELNKIKERVRSLSVDGRWRDRLGRQIVLNPREIRVIEWFADHDKMTAKDAGAVLPDVSPDTVLRTINGLTHKGVLKKLGVTKNAYYMMRK